MRAMSVSSCENYLKDLGFLIKQEALEAKSRRALARASERDFCDGRLMAYNEVLSLMKSQAIAFQIDQSVIGLNDFDPDAELN